MFAFTVKVVPYHYNQHKFDFEGEQSLFLLCIAQFHYLANSLQVFANKSATS